MAQKPISSERLDEFFEAMPRLVGQYRDRILHWMASADHTCGQVAGGASTYEQQAVFIVRLAGIFSDLRRRFGGPVLVVEEIATADYAVQLREQQRAKVVDATAALYALLSEDELLWLELRRHEQCPPFLDGYRPKPSDNDNWNRRDSKIVDREDIPLDEIIERCAKLAARYNGGHVADRASGLT